MKRKLCIATPILLLAALVAAILGLFNRFPAHTLKAIANDSGVVFYSINPSDGPKTPGPNHFHNWPILGQTVLSNAQDRKTVVAALRSAARGATMGDIAACFMPRHAFRATDKTGMYDLLLCFECGQAEIYSPDGKCKVIPIDGTPDALNQLLTTAQVPLAAKAGH